MKKSGIKYKLDRIIFNVLPLISMFLFFSKTVNAAILPDAFEKAFTWIFIRLPNAAQSGGFAQNIVIIWFKLFLFILVFSIYYYGTHKIFKGMKNVTVAVSLVLALISVILIPPTVLLFIFNEYSAITALLLGLIPIIAGLYIWRAIPSEHSIIRNVLILIFGLIAMWVGTYFTGFGLTFGGGP